MTATLPSWMRTSEIIEVAPVSPPVLQVRVLRRERLADGVVGLSLVPAEGPPPVWEPGAHIDVHLPDGGIRQYSLCTPDEAGSLRIAVLRVADGRGGSEYLHDTVSEGDLLQVSKPRNNFPLVSASAYVFIAGGIGITPMLSMIEHARAVGAEWSLTYIGRSRRSMAFLSALGEDERIRIVAKDEHGRVDVASLLSDPQTDAAVYCCGPETLMIAVEQACAEWPAGSVHLERFVPKVIEGRENTQIEVLLQRSGTELLVEPEVSILDAVLDAGVPVPWSCREGTCGTCETGLVSGEPDHRDSVLTAEDYAANDCIMVCVSRATSRRLVLDL